MAARPDKDTTLDRSTDMSNGSTFYARKVTDRERTMARKADRIRKAYERGGVI